MLDRKRFDPSVREEAAELLAVIATCNSSSLRAELCVLGVRNSGDREDGQIIFGQISEEIGLGTSRVNKWEEQGHTTYMLVLLRALIKCFFGKFGIHYRKNQPRTMIDDSDLDHIYDTVDQQFISEKFAEVDRVLEALVVENTSTDELIAFLTATLPAKSKLKKRAEFCERVKKVLAERERGDSGLLDGLT
jgi:hypothetical protein